MADVLNLQIINKMADMCLDIREDKGYLTTVREVHKGDVSYEKFKSLPAINVSLGPIEYKNPITNEAGRLIKVVRGFLDVYYEARDEHIEQKIYAELVSDIEVRFFDDTVNGNTSYGMTATANSLENVILEAIPVNVTPYFCDAQDMANFGYMMDLHFRQKRSDPTQLY